eukprot:jgi/Botrbrau1/4266/Bobra.0390s0006.1
MESGVGSPKLGVSDHVLKRNRIGRTHAGYWNIQQGFGHRSCSRRHIVTTAISELDIQPPLLPSRRTVLAVTASQAASAAAPHVGLPTANAQDLEVLKPNAGSVDIPHFPLAPDLQVSRVIKGCWQLSGGHRGDKSTDRTSKAPALTDFQSFINAGITTLDTADHYGPSEDIIGEFLQRRGGRQGVQVLTKFCCFDGMMRDARRSEYVRQAVDRSRSRLGMTPLDLLQFYWQDYGDRGYVDVALRLADLQTEGVIKEIGVTNFDVVRMQQMMDAGAPIVSNQVQYSLLDRRPENGMAAFCRERGVALLCYGTVAGGFLSDKYLGLPVSRVKADTYSKYKYGAVIQQAGGWDWFQQLLVALKAVGDRHGASISNVATKWVLDRPQVGGAIVGARNAEHITEHGRLFRLQLDAEDTTAIQEVLDQGTRPLGDCYTWERGGPW